MKKVIVIPKYAFDRGLRGNKIDDTNVEQLIGKACFISINDTFGTDEVPFFSKPHPNVLTLFFDDVDQDIVTDHGTAKAFTDEQATDIYAFIEKNKETENFIVHCTAGISRSGGVGEFINNYLDLDYNSFKECNPHILPNGLVLSKLNRFLWNDTLS